MLLRLGHLARRSKRPLLEAPRRRHPSSANTPATIPSLPPPPPPTTTTFSTSSAAHVAVSGPPLRGGNWLSDPENKGQRQAGVNFDTLGSWSHRLDMEVDVELSIKSGRLVPHISTSTIGHATVLGRRKDNEDRAKISQLSEDVLMVGIFDGHSGSVASEYVSQALENHVKYWLLEKGESKLTNVLHKAFLDVNIAFTKYLHHNYHGVGEGASAGTTATVALLRYGVELVVAQVGDSRAVLCRDGGAIQLSDDHNLDSHKEKHRVEAAGGHVIQDSLGIPRVNGRLEMSRSIGDVDLKQYGVTAEPSLRSIEVKHGGDAFLVLLTDGITYVLNNQEVVDVACTYESPRAAASFICDQALLYGTEDNCTALVVPFGAWGKYADTKKVKFSFGRNTIGKRHM